MKVKAIKFASLALVLFMFGTTLYTIALGFELSNCSSRVRYSQVYYSVEEANEVYFEVNECRAEIANRSEFDYIVCHMSNGMRFLLFFFEVVFLAMSALFCWFMIELDYEIRERQRKMAVRRRRISGR